MRVEVEIGTIEVDALLEGMSAEGLRAAVVEALEGEIIGFSGADGGADRSSFSTVAERIETALECALGAETQR